MSAILVGAWMLACSSVAAQNQKPSASEKVLRDTLRHEKVRIQPAVVPTNISANISTQQTFSSLATTSLSNTSLAADSTERSSNGIDTVVNYAAKDSVVYSLKQRRLRLRGEAYVKNQAQTLQAEIIELFFDQSTMRAQGGRDSTGRSFGEPKFVDGSENYLGETITYNFKTKRGTVSMAQTDLGEGYYFGERIKRVSENTIFVQDGCYTTCNKGHPHFYFKSPRMKVISQDRLFVDQLFVYVEDIPIFYVPLGVFMEIGGKERRSGILIPTFEFPNFALYERSPGVTFRNLGYYWAINDYVDTKFTADIFTRSGFLLRNSTQYNLNGVFSGGVEFSWGRQRFSSLEPLTENWSIGIRHTQQIDPETSVNASLNYTSPDYNRNTQFDVLSRARQVINSNAGLSKRFDNGMSTSLNYARTQNLITAESTDNFSLNANIGQILPLKGLVPSDSWLANVAITYNPSAEARLYQPPDTSRLASFAQLSPESIRVTNSTVAAPRPSAFTAVVRHNPSLTFTLPRIGYFNINISPTYRENWYFRRIKSRQYSPTDSTRLEDEYEQGFFREYEYSLSAGINTVLYGIARVNIGKLRALRHRVLPSISYSFNPTFLNNRDLFGSYTDRSGIIQYYSRFEGDGSGGVNRIFGQNINFSMGNDFEAKIADTDTSETNVQLLNVGLNASYNLAAEQFKLSPIGMNFRTTAGIIDFSGGASFDPYNRIEVDRAISTTATARVFERINQLSIASGQGLMRLMSVNFGINTQFSSEGIKKAQTSAATLPDTTQQQKKESTEDQLRERFRQRADTSQQPADLFGDSSPGYEAVAMPWNLGLGANLSYNEAATPEARALFSAALNATFSFTIENSWRVQANAYYDVLSNQPPTGTISISKDLHCWDLSFSWTPFGYSQGFSLRLGIKASQLRDVQIQRRSDPQFPRY